MEEAGDLDEVVHEVAIEPAGGGDENVVALPDLQRLEGEKLGIPAVPARLLHELEQVVMEGRKPGGSLG
jgi:hypothetical protein